MNILLVLLVIHICTVYNAQAMPEDPLTSWTPRLPTKNDQISIHIISTNQYDFLHWGVNARGAKWGTPIPDYLPPDSTNDGAATRTRLVKQSDDSCALTLGPFNHPSQQVSSIDFVLYGTNNLWSNNGGDDYHIPVTQARISIKPTAPTLNDPIEITVHECPSTNGWLRWGVNARLGKWEKPVAACWPDGSVPSDDGLAVDSPLPVPDKEGNATLTLGPFNSGRQAVTSLHMAVHWDNVWDTDVGRNYNVPVNLNVSGILAIISPQPEQGYQYQLPVTTANNSGNPASIWIDGKPIVSLMPSCNQFFPALDSLTYGEHILTIRAEVPGGAAMDAVTFWRVPGKSREEPPAGTKSGAHADENGNWTFALYAPGKHYVSLIGNFNDWDIETDPMHSSSNGLWWLKRKLPDGTNYYQFCVDGVRLADPYARDVEWKNKEGRETWQPSNALSVIKAGQPEYQWTSTNYRRPGHHELVIYECFIEDLCPGQGFTGMTARLDYIKELGFNAIEPLPVTEYTGGGQWGYNPAFHFAPESHYGTPNELKKLIDEAHNRGMAVILDMVFNHMCGTAPLYRLYGEDYEASPYFHNFLGENWGMPDLDQESDAAKQYFKDVVSYWLKDYRVDGFRYDATRWTGWEGYNDWGAGWFAYAAKQTDPASIQIAEHMPSDPALINSTGMDTTWHGYFRWQIRDMIENAHLDTNAFIRIFNPVQLGFSNSLQRITYTESHDEERICRVLEEKGFEGRERLDRAISAICFTLTAPGIPMLYAGQEFGEDSKKYVGPNPLNWPYTNEESGQELMNTVQKLCHLRTSSSALHQDNLVILLMNSQETGIAAFERRSGREAVRVISNFSRKIRQARLPASGDLWLDVLTGTEVSAERNQPITLELRPGQTRILTSRH